MEAPGAEVQRSSALGARIEAQKALKFSDFQAQKDEFGAFWD